MASIVNTETVPVQSQLLGGAVLPVHQLVEAECGSAFYWEQRYWLDFIGIDNPKNYRKNEKRRQTLEKVIASWALSDSDFARPSGGELNARTLLFSSRMLLAWLFAMRRGQEKSNHNVDETIDKLERCITEIFAVSQKGMRFGEGSCSMTVFGVNVEVNNEFMVDLTELCRQWPDLEEDWGQLRETGLAFMLPAFAHDGKHKLGELMSFLEARAFYSQTARADTTWLLDFRNAALQLITHMFEAQVAQDIDASTTLAQEQKELRTPTGRCQPSSSLKKLMFIDKVRKQKGSSETILHALAASKGYASFLQYQSNNLYCQHARQTMVGVFAAGLNWDAACHSGLDLNVAMVLNIESNDACYLKPQV